MKTKKLLHLLVVIAVLAWAVSHRYLRPNHVVQDRSLLVTVTSKFSVQANNAPLALLACTASEDGKLAHCVQNGTADDIANAIREMAKSQSETLREYCGVKTVSF